MRKRSFIILIFFVLLFLSGSKSYSSFTNFDFSLKEYLISENAEVKVHFFYLLSGVKNTDFVVKPLLGNGTVEIFNPDKKNWEGSFSSENALPNLSEDMLIKVQNLNVDKTYLWFEIKSIRDGKLYSTPKKSIWGEKVYDGYVEEMNYSISNLRVNERESEEILEVEETSKSYRNPYLELVQNTPKEYYLYLGLFLFPVSAVFGFVFKKSRFKREMIQSVSEDFEKLVAGNTDNASHLYPFFYSRRSGEQITGRE